LSTDSEVAKKCDIAEESKKAYLYISSCYFALTILIPMISIVILNSLIIYKSKQDELKRNQFKIVAKPRSKIKRRNALKESIVFRPKKMFQLKK